MHKQYIFHTSTIHYTKQGTGLPVILLHGFGEDATVFDSQVKFLQDYCCVITPHLPGSGNSSLLVASNADGIILIEDYAHCINALLEAENIHQCILLGHSMGGYITLAFAELYPQKLLKFGLIHSTAFADSDEKKNVRLKGIALMEEYGSYAFLKNTIPNLFGEEFKKQHTAVINELIEYSANFSKTALQQYYKAMMLRKDRTFVLQNSEKPVLFILGTQDVAAPLHDVLQQVYLPQTSYIHILENVGHMGMLEATEVLNKHLVKFIIN